MLQDCQTLYSYRPKQIKRIRVYLLTLSGPRSAVSTGGFEIGSATSSSSSIGRGCWGRGGLVGITMGRDGSWVTGRDGGCVTGMIGREVGGSTGTGWGRGWVTGMIGRDVVGDSTGTTTGGVEGWGIGLGGKGRAGIGCMGAPGVMMTAPGPPGGGICGSGGYPSGIGGSGGRLLIGCW